MCTSFRWAEGRKFASGVNGVVNQVIGGWQTSGTLTLKEGFPLTIDGSNNNNFGVGQHVNVVGDYHIAHPGPNAWFNTAAFANGAGLDSRETLRDTSPISAHPATETLT